MVLCLLHCLVDFVGACLKERGVIVARTVVGRIQAVSLDSCLRSISISYFDCHPVKNFVPFHSFWPTLRGETRVNLWESQSGVSVIVIIIVDLFVVCAYIFKQLH